MINFFKKERNDVGRMAKRSAFLDMKNLVKIIGRNNLKIVDGGANKGRTVRKFLEIFSESIIYVFEPLDIYQEKLSQIDKAKVFQYGLSNKQEKKIFYSNSQLSTSSFLIPKVIKKYHKNKVISQKESLIDCVSLDYLFENKKIEKIDILKLDLQGYELKALQGADRLLRNISIVYLEISFVELYEGQGLFCDISRYLTEKGFRLYNFYDLFTHDDGQLTSGDAIFINKSIYDTK